MIDVTSRLCQGKRGVDRGGRGVCERACRGRAARMATPAAMCATHSLTTSPCARVTPRARARASSRSRRTHVAHVSGESAGVGGVAARSGADETPSTCGVVSDPARDFAVAPSPSKLSRRASAGRAKHRRGAISAEWGSGEYDGGFDDAAETPATPAGPSSRDHARSLSTKTRTSVRVSTHSADTKDDTKDEKKDGAHDTELVMVLERRGEGWAEEVFPHVAMRRRPVARSAAAAAARGTHAPDSAQAYLEKTLRMSRDEAASIVSAAAAWRVTRGGRALVDRKIMRAVQANAAAAVEALRELGASVEDVPDLLRRMPQILAVVPTDEWNRNLLEYVVRARVPGGGRFGPLKLKARLPAQKSMNQAEASIERRAAAEARKTRRIARNEHILEMNARGFSGSRDGQTSVTSRRARAGADPLKPWVEDVRDKRQCGRLTQEQLYLLDIAGFDATVKEAAGGESNRTWEMWFDELVEYKSVVGSCEVPENRVDAGLGLWVQRQRVKRAEGTLSEKALARLLALGVSFEGYECSADGESPNDRSAKTKSTRKSAKEVVTHDAARSNAVTKKPSSTTTPSSSALDRETLSMVASLKAFQKERGEFAEPPLGSELAVWLANVRNRAATVGASDAERDQKQSMSPAERDALLALGVELENFSPVWLGELERFASLRAHRVTLHDPKAHAAFVRRERAAANAGLCSRARLMRLRHVGMSGVAGALLLDDCELRGVDECLSAEALAQSGPYDGSDGGSLAAKTVAALPLRENALARDAARAAREEAKREASAGDRPGELRVKPSARARARPTPVPKRREAARTRRHQNPAGEESERPVSSDAPFAPDASPDREAREMLAEQMRAGKAVYVD